MSSEILDKIHSLLNEAGVTYRELEHSPTYTSAESAAVRGEHMNTGAKALLLKTDEVFRLFVLPADRKLSSRAIRHHLHVSRTRFATREELHELTGLVPGCVPPFGKPILPFEMYADDAVGVVSERVAFNAGSLTRSIIMAAEDWEKIAKPVRFSFSRES